MSTVTVSVKIPYDLTVGWDENLSTVVERALRGLEEPVKSKEASMVDLTLSEEAEALLLEKAALYEVPLARVIHQALVTYRAALSDV